MLRDQDDQGARCRQRPIVPMDPSPSSENDQCVCRSVHETLATLTELDAWA